MGRGTASKQATSGGKQAGVHASWPVPWRLAPCRGACFWLWGFGRRRHAETDALDASHAAISAPPRLLGPLAPIGHGQPFSSPLHAAPPDLTSAACFDCPPTAGLFSFPPASPALSCPAMPLDGDAWHGRTPPAAANKRIRTNKRKRTRGLDACGGFGSGAARRQAEAALALVWTDCSCQGILLFWRRSLGPVARRGSADSSRRRLPLYPVSRRGTPASAWRHSPKRYAAARYGVVWVWRSRAIYFCFLFPPLLLYSIFIQNRHPVSMLLPFC